MLRSFALVAVLLAAAAALSACDVAESGDQLTFEDQAYLTPAGTAPVWRIGPAFDARMRLASPPTPNPATLNDEVALTLTVDVAAPGGFELRGLDAEGRLGGLVASVDGLDAPNIYIVAFLARRVDPLNRPGTYRLLLLDARDRVVAYGDVTLTN